MGGTITLVPDGFVSSLTRGWVVVGGGTLNSAVADASDATYITDTTPGSGSTRITWTFATSSLPAGAAVKYSYPVVRNSQPTGNRQLTVSLGTYNPPDNISYQSPAKIWTPVAGLADTPGTAAGAVPQSRSQGVVDLLIVSVLQYPSSAFAEDHRIYKVESKVVYVDSPTASGAALYPPSANTLTTRPGVQWSFNNADGFTQYEYRVALWKLSDINLHTGGRAGFEAAINDIFVNTSFTGTDALPHSAKWRSNGGASGSWVVSADNNVSPDVDLDGASQYVYYVQVSALHANERLAHPTSFSSLDFTQSITTPAAPTSVTPTWNGAPDYRTFISVGIPAQALGAWDGRKLVVQRRLSGSTSEDDWYQLPQETVELGAGSATYPVYDTLAAPTGRALEYRAKVYLWSSLGYQSSSAWVVSSTATPVYDAFVLRDPMNILVTPLVLKPLGDFVATQEEVQGVFRPLGSDRPVVVSDRVTGRRWSLEVRVKNRATELQLEALREARTPLVLQTDMDKEWYWVRLGSSVQRNIRRQINRLDETKREQVWSLDLIEVDAPLGQPRSY